MKATLTIIEDDNYEISIHSDIPEEAKERICGLLIGMLTNNAKTFLDSHAGEGELLEKRNFN